MKKATYILGMLGVALAIIGFFFVRPFIRPLIRRKPKAKKEESQ